MSTGITLQHPASPFVIGTNVLTRSAETESAYLLRASNMIKKVSRKLRVLEATPLEVAAHIIEMKPNWTRSTWRQNKACLMYYFGIMNTKECIEAIGLLECEGESECKRKSDKVGKRRKNITNEEMQVFIDTLGTIGYSQLLGSSYRQKNDGYRRKTEESTPPVHASAHLAQTWLILTTMTGLRPHEWCHSTLVTSTGHPDDGAGPFLRVENSKRSNSRSHGKYRHLDLSKCNPVVLNGLTRFLAFMQGVMFENRYAAVYSGCVKAILATNRLIYGNNKDWITLYSGRHKFSSECKFMLPLEQVATLMGHATDRTAAVHYGKITHGSGTLMVSPVRSEVAKVKITGYKIPAAMKVKGHKKGKA